MPLFLYTVPKPWRPEAQPSTACKQQEDSMKVWGWIQKTHWWAIVSIIMYMGIEDHTKMWLFQDGELSIAKVWQPMFRIPRISRTALNSFKGERICIPGDVHKPLWINHFSQTMKFWDAVRIDLTFLKYSTHAVVLVHKYTCLI